MMKNNLAKTILISIIATLAMLTTAQASNANASKDIVIIVHKSNPLTSISKKELANIFLGKMVLWDSGKRISAGMLPTDNLHIKDFLKQVCNKSVKRFNAHWMKFIFSGSGVRPKIFTSSINASYFVGSNKNAIAAVDELKLNSNIKLLKIVE